MRGLAVSPRAVSLHGAIAAKITPRTRAILPVHLYGNVCDMDGLQAVARRHNLAIVEDCAQAHLAAYKGRPVGTLGHASFFSFQTLKPLNTYGGGMALMNTKSEQWETYNIPEGLAVGVAFGLLAMLGTLFRQLVYRRCSRR